MDFFILMRWLEKHLPAKNTSIAARVVFFKAGIPSRLLNQRDFLADSS